MTITLPGLLKQYNTTSYKKWDGILQIKHYATGLFHYFNAVTLAELPMTSIKNLFEEN